MSIADRSPINNFTLLLKYNFAVALSNHFVIVFVSEKDKAKADGLKSQPKHGECDFGFTRLLAILTGF